MTDVISHVLVPRHRCTHRGALPILYPAWPHRTRHSRSQRDLPRRWKLTVEELPDQGLGKSEITALIDKEVNETLTSVWGDDVLPWYLRPTKVFGQKNESDATSQMDLVEFENWYLTQAMTGMEWRLDIKGFEQI